MSDVDKRSLWELRNEYRSMPYGTGRVTAVLDALVIAEQLDPLLRASVLYDLAWAYAVGDDPAKALPVCAEFLALLEKHPEYERCRIEAPSAAMIGAYVATSLPQIPLEQCRALLEEFHRQVKKYGVGERLWQQHACALSLQAGDMAGAEEHLRVFRHTRRDIISDCAACEASNIAECLLDMGRREEARRELQPVLDGALTCEDQPWSVLSVLIHDALDNGELDNAKDLGQRLARKKLYKRSDLACAGAMLHLQAYGGAAQTLSLLEKGIRWSVGMWDQKHLFDFYRGAWAFCESLRGQEPVLPLSLPKKFSRWRADGLYDTAALAEWLHTQAIEIAARFDRRNGSNYFSKRLSQFAPPDRAD